MNRYFYLFLIAVLSFWVVGYVDQEQELLLAIVNAIATSLAMAIVVAFTPAVYLTFRLPPKMVLRSHLLLVGAWTISIAAFIRFGWLWVYRLTQLSWMLHHDVFAWGAWWFVVGALILLMAEKSAPYTICTKEWIHIAAWIGLGLVLSLISITLAIKMNVYHLR